MPSRDAIAITPAAFLFALWLVAYLRSHWPSRTRAEGDYYYKASVDGVEAGELARRNNEPLAPSDAN